MGFNDEFKKHLEVLGEGLTECRPEDITIKSLALNGLVGEFWTDVLRHVMQKDDFFIKDIEQFKIDLKTVGKEQAEKNQTQRFMEHLQKISNEKEDNKDNPSN